MAKKRNIWRRLYKVNSRNLKKINTFESLTTLMVAKETTEDTQLAEDLKDYAVLIERAAAKTTPEIVPNFGLEFSSLLMAKMFDLAKKEVNIVLHDFSGKISDHQLYVAALEAALNRGVKFRVIILGDVNDKSLALDKLLEYYNKPDLVKIYTGNSNTLIELKKFFKINKEINFSVIDGEHFRYEYDIKEFEAIGVFNVPNDAEKFNIAFKHLLNYTKPKP